MSEMAFEEILEKLLILNRKAWAKRARTMLEEALGMELKNFTDEQCLEIVSDALRQTDMEED